MDRRGRGSRRRGGHPNRGGGRHQRGRGGSHSASRGGSDGRKAGGSAAEGGFAEDFSLAPREPARGLSSSQRRSSRRPSRRGAVHAPMEKLHMSNANQEMVLSMLQNLRTDDPPSYADSTQYDDGNSDDERHTENRDPHTDSEESGSEQEGFDLTELEEHSVNKFAVNKLLRYGFDKDRCVLALQLHEGDIGQSLEYLMCSCFEVNLPNAKESISANFGDNLDAILSKRDEEKLALQCIYDTNFEERIPNSVWRLNLKLPALDSVLEKLRPDPIPKQFTSINNVCRYFKSGHCKYGKNCRYSHDLSNKKKPSEKPDHLQVKDDCPYKVEIRFPQNSIYPLEPPLIAFYSSVDEILPHSCLHITSEMLNDAKKSADLQEPAIFSAVCLLEDESLLVELLRRPPSKFSLPQPIISRKESASNDDFVRMPLIDSQIKPRMSRASDNRWKLDSNQVENVEEPAEEPVVVQKFGRKDIVPRKRNEKEIWKENQRLREQFKRKRNTSSYKTMRADREKLPAWSMQDDILDALDRHQVIVVSGMTGCGKTTQVPQYIMDASLNDSGKDLCHVICTQPRRISAITVAERVANERNIKLGGIVGYHIRLESVQSSSTRVLFCTTGIILRRLESDPQLMGITHLIVDEVHERTEESDFLLMIVRDILETRRDLKVILMSATMNARLFSDYFSQCPILFIPGKTFPVEQYFLEDVFEITGFVMDEKSPYARPLKRMNAVRSDGGKTKGRQLADSFEDEFQAVSNVSSSSFPADKVLDQNLSVQQLFMRYADYSKSTLKMLSLMDMEKINYELIEALLEWIVDGDHERTMRQERLNLLMVLSIYTEELDKLDMTSVANEFVSKSDHRKRFFGYPPYGAVLVFLPGFAEIQTLFDILQANSTFGPRSNRVRIFPLHSSLSSEDQQAVFRHAREGVTKIVIATNIAETSITIDDVMFVIDSGRMKEKRYDASKGMESLDMTWVSQANAVQRKGRAGRVAAGVAFHLFTSNMFDFHLKEQPIPEIQRVPLEQIVLKIKMLDILNRDAVEDVLFRLPEPPSEEAIFSATKRLQDLGALDHHNNLTSLGYHLGSLPVDVRIGKLMLLGAIFRCLDAALTIAATLSFKSPFVSPFDKRDEADKKKLEFACGSSDHLTMLNAYRGWIEAKQRGSNEAYSFCRENFLSIKSLQMLASMKQQFVELLSDIGFVKEGLTVRDVDRAARRRGDGVIEATGEEANSNSSNWKLVSALLVGALFPNVVQVMSPESTYSQSSAGTVLKKPKPEELRFKTKTDDYVHIHPSSVNFQVRYYESPYLVYHEKVKTTKVYLRDCSMVSVYSLLLFGGGSVSMDLEHGKFVLSVDDGWIRFVAESHKVAELLRELRYEVDQLLEEKIQNPSTDLCTCPHGSRVIDTIVHLISTQ